MISERVEELEEERDELVAILTDVYDIAKMARSNPKSLVELTEALNKIIKLTEKYHIPF